MTGSTLFDKETRPVTGIVSYYVTLTLSYGEP
jgi:hypothetical protein